MASTRKPPPHGLLPSLFSLSSPSSRLPHTSSTAIGPGNCVYRASLIYYYLLSCLQLPRQPPTKEPRIFSHSPSPNSQQQLSHPVILRTRRMHSIKSQSTPVKDGRRVLGEKTVNACQSPASRNVDALLKTGSPVKRSLFKGLSPRKLSSPFCAGQKRTIDDVEGNEVTKPGSRGIMQLVPSLNKEQAQGSEVQSAAEDGRQVSFDQGHTAEGGEVDEMILIRCDIGSKTPN